jgi:hypothetical protein
VQGKPYSLASASTRDDENANCVVHTLSDISVADVLAIDVPAAADAGASSDFVVCGIQIRLQPR